MIRILLALSLLLNFSVPAWAQFAEDELLAPEVAFAMQARVEGDEVVADWTIADGYYLYRDRFLALSQTPGISLGELDIPEGKIKDDPAFGKVAIFRKQVQVRIPIYVDGPKPRQLVLEAGSQGCADVGVCYPPHRKRITLDLPATSVANEVAKPASPASNPLKGLTDLVESGLGADDDEPLPPEEAFKPTVSVVDGNHIRIDWFIAEGYYLYQERLKFKVLAPEGVSFGEAELPKAKIKDDPTFGKTPVYFNELYAVLPVNRPAGDALDLEIEYGYQGCASIGLCYPPEKRSEKLTLPAFDGVSQDSGAQSATTSKPASSGATPVATAASAPVAGTEQDRITALLSGSSVWVVIGIMFVAGLGLAFTACVYPMIPILSSIIVGEGENVTPAKGFLLSFIYVQGVAITYALIGVASGFAGAGVQAFFQNPLVLTLFAVMFVALALSMFGFYNIQLPSGLQGKLTEMSNNQQGGKLVGVFIMGVLSALIVGPCAGPVMVGAAAFIAQSQDWVLGGLAFYAMGNGIGAPLLLVGAFGGQFLPRAGTWMDTVKAVFGVVLLFVAVLMLERVLPGPVALAVYATLFIVSGIYMGAFESLAEGHSGWRKLWKGLGLVMVFWGAITLIGAATGGRDVTNPLHRLMAAQGAGGGGEASAHVSFKRIKTVEDLQSEIAAANARGQAVMLDFYADWCTYCITLEDYVFPHPQVRAALTGVHLIQADVTANDDDDRALMNHVDIFAPPAILFYGLDGQERRDYRVVGAIEPEDFATRITAAVGR
ncbi:MAG: protein-disulfide reductase DsbD [Gammaproteobacteria bacterium]